MSTASANKSTSSNNAVRPYTSYNLFFQLEREYILQTLLGFTPTNITPTNIFDPADRTNYSGPPLPTRYSNLLLPYDWHIPGKTQRRKRSHRKSHGKIGFHELNERISKAWQVVDEETKKFCMLLSEVESKKYKKIQKAEKKQKKQQQSSNNASIKPSAAAGNNKNLNSIEEENPQVNNNKSNKDTFINAFDHIDWSSSPNTMMEDNGPIISRKVSQLSATNSTDQEKNDCFVPQAITTVTKNNNRRRSRHHSKNVNTSFATMNSSSSGGTTSSLIDDEVHRVSITEEVDIADELIIDMWKSINFDDADHPSSTQTKSSSSQEAALCIEKPSASTSSASLTVKTSSASVSGIVQDLEQEQLSAQVNDNMNRMSFIDAEYEMFQEIGKQFSSKGSKRKLQEQQQQGYCNGVVVEGSSAVGVGSESVLLRRNSITAAQA